MKLRIVAGIGVGMLLLAVGGWVTAVFSQTGSHHTYLPLIRSVEQPPSLDEWPTVAANPERTSWNNEEVSGQLQVQWYRPIEAYISQNVQIIASGGLLYIATARGLYALHAHNGSLAWRFDTELPLGNSPTVADGVVYVGGYDKKLHALNAQTGAHLWSFTGATAGYDTNPLVVNGLVVAGNRDGTVYAVGAHGTAQQGQLVWHYQTGGSIHLSAAYKDGVVYLAANDNRAYALRLSDGSLLWQSAKLPGDGFHGYWPVIYRNKIILATAQGYRDDLNPGERSVDSTNYDLRGIWPEMEEGLLIGPEASPQAWANEFPVVDARRILDYYEDNPHGSNPYAHKPWRRAFVVLDRQTGQEFTFDSNSNGHAEYMPVFWWHTYSGTLYPGIVGPDNILYHNNAYQCCLDAKGKVYGWNIETPQYLSKVGSRWYGHSGGGFGAMAEPQAISGGGNRIYRNLCCDRVGDWFTIDQPAQFGTMWSYNLHNQAPGYDAMWFVYPESIARLWAWYQGNQPFYENQDIDPYTYNSVNGIYAGHGLQNPIIPYNGRLFVHRSNAIIAYGNGPGPGQLPVLEIEAVVDHVQTPTPDQLRQRLAAEIGKIIEAGPLRPGYYVMGQHADYGPLNNYFENPGDTLYTLAIAYPHLSPNLQAEVVVYLAGYFQTYFDPALYATVGWVDGAAREAMPLPTDIIAYLESEAQNPTNPQLHPSPTAPWFSWAYPPQNFYAMYQYALRVPGVDVDRTYELARSRINDTLSRTSQLSTTDFQIRPYEHNAYLTGYIGFLALQELAGMSGPDANLRQAVITERNRLLTLKYELFDKDTWWIENPALFPNDPDRTNLYQRKEMDIARNFMWLVPELGDYFRAELLAEVEEALTEYNYVAPYWFVARYEAFPGEGATSSLWNYPALFQAKAFILQEDYDTLYKYLDVPAFARGDLFYIQNLVATLNSE